MAIRIQVFYLLELLWFPLCTTRSSLLPVVMIELIADSRGRLLELLLTQKQVLVAYSCHLLMMLHRVHWWPHVCDLCVLDFATLLGLGSRSSH